MRKTQRQGEWLSTLLLYGIVFLLAALSFLIIRPFLSSLAWAAVLAILCYPWTEPLRSRWGTTRAAAAGTAGVTLILIVPALLLTILFTLEGVQAARNLQEAIVAGRFEWVNRGWNWLAERAGESGSDLPTMVRGSTGRVGTFLAAQLGLALSNIVVLLFHLFVTLFALFYFIRDGDAIMDALRRALPLEENLREEIFAKVRGLIHASVRVSLVIAAVQGLLGGMAFALVGIGSPVFWGIAMAFLALLPVVGTWPIWVPATIWLFATGHATRAVILLVICIGLVGTIDNILRPIMLSGSASMNGLLVFVSVLGGVAAFGMLGIVLGPLVIALAIGALDVYGRRDEPRKTSPANLPAKAD